MKAREFAELILNQKHVNSVFVEAVVDALNDVAHDEDAEYFEKNLDSYMVGGER